MPLTYADYFASKQIFFQTHSYSGRKTIALVPVAILLRQDVCIERFTGVRIDQVICNFVRKFLETTLYVPFLVYDFSTDSVRLPERPEEVITLINDLPLEYDVVTTVSQHKPMIERAEPPVLWTFTAVLSGSKYGNKPAVRIYSNSLKLYNAFQEFKRWWKEYVFRGKDYSKKKFSTKIEPQASDYAYYSGDFFVQFVFDKGGV